MPARRTVTPLALAALWIVMHSACTGGSTGPDQTPVVDAVTLSPTSLTLLLDQEQTVAATPRANGQPLADRLVSWATSDANVASVSDNGRVRALMAGSARITASSEGRSASADVAVQNPPPAVTQIAPATAVVGSADVTVSVTGSGFASDATVEWNGAERATTWISRTQVAALVPAADIAIAGEAAIAVRNPAPGGGRSSEVPFTITTIPVDTVVVTPTAAVLVPGASLQLTATPRSAAGEALPGRPVTWSSGSDVIATVDDGGTVQGAGAGVTTVTATSEGQSTVVDVTVLAGGLAAPGGSQIVVGFTTLNFPAGAVAVTTAITVAANANPPADARLIAGSTVDLGPSPSAFAQPVTVQLDWIAEQEGGREPSRFAVHRWNGAAWEALANAVNNAGARSAAGTTNAFSVFALLELPNPVPVIAAIDPTTVTAGLDALLTVTGSEFLPSSQVLVDGAPVPTTLQGNQLVANIPASALIAPGVHEIRVRNPAPGGGDSNPLQLAVVPPSINVTTTADQVGNAAVCSLRAAVMAANTNVAVDACPAGSSQFPDVIMLPTGTYILASQLMVTDPVGLTMRGAGQGNTILDGGGVTRLVQNAPTAGLLTVESMTMRNGRAPGFGANDGGAIAGDGPVKVSNVTFSGNHANGEGGALKSRAPSMIVENSIFNGNTANGTGGAIEFDGLLSVSGSQFNGNQSLGSEGGAIEFTSGELVVNESQFVSNQAFRDGGAIRTSDGSITVTMSTFSGNTAGSDGGAIRNSVGSIAATGSTFNGNSAGADGGAIRGSATTVTISSSTFLGNVATDDGGGVRMSGGVLEVMNSTFNGNGAQTPTLQSEGGGAIRAAGSQAALRHVTITGSSGGAVQLSAAGNLVIVNSILDGNGGGSCVGDGVPTSQGGNVSLDDTCGLVHATDLQNTGSQLGILGPNGGPTQTRLPGPASPAIDRGVAAGCTATDQRGVMRPQGPACDAGSVEIELLHGDVITRNDYDRHAESRSAQGVRPVLAPRAAQFARQLRGSVRIFHDVDSVGGHDGAKEEGACSGAPFSFGAAAIQFLARWSRQRSGSSSTSGPPACSLISAFRSSST
jgi:CSLREA domain-containing protein